MLNGIAWAALAVLAIQLPVEEASQRPPNPPLAHGAFMVACLQGGGSTGYTENRSRRSLLQLQRDNPKHVELSLLTTDGYATRLISMRPNGEILEINLFGSHSYADRLISAMIEPTAPVAWCVHYR